MEKILKNVVVIDCIEFLLFIYDLSSSKILEDKNHSQIRKSVR